MGLSLVSVGDELRCEGLDGTAIRNGIMSWLSWTWI